MIDTNCRWGLLFGGKHFMAFYLKHVMDGNDLYYHLVASNIHQAFTTSEPNLISVIIALLLGGPNDIVANYSPPVTTVLTKYTPAKSKRPTRSKNPQYSAPKKGRKGGKAQGKQPTSRGRRPAPTAGITRIQVCLHATTNIF